MHDCHEVAFDTSKAGMQCNIKMKRALHWKSWCVTHFSKGQITGAPYDSLRTSLQKPFSAIRQSIQCPYSRIVSQLEVGQWLFLNFNYTFFCWSVIETDAFSFIPSVISRMLTYPIWWILLGESKGLTSSECEGSEKNTFSQFHDSRLCNIRTA